MTTHFRIITLHCDACVKFCTLKFRKIPGVTSVKIELATGDASVEAEQAVSLGQLQEALAGTDYTIHPAASSQSEAIAD